MTAVAEPFEALAPVSLEEMNDRAALQRRTDNKYLVPVDSLTRLLADLGESHQVLDIDDERMFQYESVYFDTDGLRCFRDHVADRTPRYKTRTRCYVTTGDCFFEVKVKDAAGATTKRQLEYDPDERDRLTEDGQKLLEHELAEFGIEVTEDHDPSLITAFQRATVIDRERPERTTFDFEVILSDPSGDSVRLDPRYAIAETKTEDGSGAWDRGLSDADIEPVSLSKYRVGTGLLCAPAEDGGYARDLKGLFRARAPSR